MKLVASVEPSIVEGCQWSNGIGEYFSTSAYIRGVFPKIRVIFWWAVAFHNIFLSVKVKHHGLKALCHSLRATTYGQPVERAHEPYKVLHLLELYEVRFVDTKWNSNWVPPWTKLDRFLLDKQKYKSFAYLFIRWEIRNSFMQIQYYNKNLFPVVETASSSSSNTCS